MCPSVNRYALVNPPLNNSNFSQFLILECSLHEKRKLDWEIKCIIVLYFDLFMSVQKPEWHGSLFDLQTSVSFCDFDS